MPTTPVRAPEMPMSLAGAADVPSPLRSSPPPQDRSTPSTNAPRRSHVARPNCVATWYPSQLSRLLRVALAHLLDHTLYRGFFLREDREEVERIGTGCSGCAGAESASRGARPPGGPRSALMHGVRLSFQVIAGYSRRLGHLGSTPPRRSPASAGSVACHTSKTRSSPPAWAAAAWRSSRTRKTIGRHRAASVRPWHVHRRDRSARIPAPRGSPSRTCQSSHHA